uniref:Angiopoietin 1 n=1 Tax=Eptatretus burgeri TaxID=7764 RepID=A0A8C4PYF2_EPTBU
MLRLGVALFRHATEHAGKLADVEAQFLNQTVSLEKDLREQTESRKKLEKQLQHQINYMDHLKERHGVLRRSLHDLEWQQHRWVSAARWDERGLRRVLVQRGRVMDGLQGHLAMSAANGSALRRRQVQLQRAVHGLLAASHAGLHGAHGEESVPFQDCAGAYNAGNTKSGVYTIQASGISKPIKVYCDMEIKGGGWTLIQHRGDGSVDFHRKWVEYKQGFGDPSGDHWLGNQHVFELTHQQAYVLRIELQDWDNGTAYVQYNTFYVASEKLQYRIYVKGFSGTAGKYSSLSQSGVSFSTKDADNDNCVCRCAHMATGGWWFDACGPSNLNGMYYTGGQHVGKFNGIKWHYWKGSSYSLRLTTMKIRPLSFSRGRRGGRAADGTDAHPAGM